MKSELASTLYWSAYTFVHAQREQQIPWQSLETTLATQRRRVRQIVRHAWESVPFYREAMQARGLRPEHFRNAEDLAQLPLIDGRIYSENPGRFRSTHVQGDVLSITSSGTTGRTKQFDYDGRALFLSLAHGHRQRHVLAHFTGKLAGYRELNLARDGGVASQIRAYYDDHLWTPRHMDLTRQFLTPGTLPLEEEVARINSFRPDVIRGYGSYLGALYRAISRRGLPFHRPRVLVYGADSMPAADRARIENELKIPVVSIYQSTEALHIGFQCTLRHGFHLDLDSVAFRLVDQEGRDVAPGQPGQVVISNLTNRATVLLNYRLGDIAVLGARPCPCGRTLPVLDSLEGRSDDVIHLDDGRTLHALQLLRQLRLASGVDQIQVIQEGARVYRIHAVDEGAIDRPAAASHLAQELDALTGARNNVSVDWLDALPAELNGKTRIVISRLQA